MWTVLGFPLTSVVIPIWLLDDGKLPNVLQADDTGNAPFCDLALQLKNKVFSNQNDASENYLNLSALMNKENSGVRQKLIPTEEDVLEKSKSLLNRWRSTRINKLEAEKFYLWVDNVLYPQIKNNFSVD